ncbi:MAG: hypothetical protein P4L99_14035 [Chthoniobacter sp.]|nr:hypothetical protein [Chthoniobacter sp.]
MSLPVVVVGLVLFTVPQGRAQATKKTGAPAAPAPGGLFPDPEPVLVPKASLRGLLEALLIKDSETAGPMIWQLLAAMFKARELGTGPSEFLAAGYRSERLKGSDAGEVQNCLLSAWSGAQTLGLFTPENIALMERGTSPRAPRGMDQGKTVNFDMEQLPAVTLTTKPPARKAAPAAVPLPAPEPVAVAPAFVVKTVEIHMHDRVPLDACGLRNMDFRLDSVDPHGSVSFLFEDRTVHAYSQVDRRDSLNKLGKGMGLSDGLDRMTAFIPEAIPDSNLRGVKLVTLPFAAVYLNEDIGVQVTFHVVIRVASEALMYDQLPPERRRLYEINTPPP